MLIEICVTLEVIKDHAGKECSHGEKEMAEEVRSFVRRSVDYAIDTDKELDLTGVFINRVHLTEVQSISESE